MSDPTIGHADETYDVAVNFTSRSELRPLQQEVRAHTAAVNRLREIGQQQLAMASQVRAAQQAQQRLLPSVMRHGGMGAMAGAMLAGVQMRGRGGLSIPAFRGQPDFRTSRFRPEAGRPIDAPGRPQPQSFEQLMSGGPMSGGRFSDLSNVMRSSAMSSARQRMGASAMPAGQARKLSQRDRLAADERHRLRLMRWKQQAERELSAPTGMAPAMPLSAAERRAIDNMPRGPEADLDSIRREIAKLEAQREAQIKQQRDIAEVRDQGAP